MKYPKHNLKFFNWTDIRTHKISQFNLPHLTKRPRSITKLHKQLTSNGTNVDHQKIIPNKYEHFEYYIDVLVLWIT